MQSIWADLLMNWSAVSGQCLLRTSTVRSLGGWDETRNESEDTALFLRLTRLGPVVLLPEIVHEYRIHPGQVRPHDAGRIMGEVRSSAISELSGKERSRAERIEPREAAVDLARERLAGAMEPCHAA